MLTIVMTLQSCYFVDFFRRSRDAGESGEGNSSDVLGDDLGAKAGGRNDAALASVYAVATTKAPAAVRPDPDLLARRLLRQFRSEGTTLARSIGEVENYRQLLGGASIDFATAPATGYDATSVLAAMKVAEEICRALVAPSDWEHPGWQTILPAAVTDVRTNLVFLAQRITGVSSNDLSSAKIDQLETIFDNANTDGQVTADDYVSPCTAVVLDAQAMLM